jgi:hypothetical protein
MQARKINKLEDARAEVRVLLPLCPVTHSSHHFIVHGIILSFIEYS